MASYHLRVKTVSRSDGRSAPAAAAYRSGARIECRQQGKVHDYSRRSGVLHERVLLPEGAPDWAHDREALWNAAEAAERRKDATTAREWEAALPAELDQSAQIALAEEFAAALVERYGVAADVAVHAPHREGDQRNVHAHILTTTRRMGEEGLAEKTRVLDSAKTGSAEISEMRELWAELQNRALEAAHSDERVDHRSLEARRLEREAQAEAAREGEEERLALALAASAEALDRPPEPRLGVGVTALERKARRKAEEEGEAYTPVTAVGAEALRIRAAREELAALDAQAAETAELWLTAEAARAAAPSGVDEGDGGAGAAPAMTPDDRGSPPERERGETGGAPLPPEEEAPEAAPRAKGRGRGPGWSDYLEAKAQHRAERAAHRTAEEERRAEERSALRAEHQAERDAMWAQDWSGRGDVLTALRSLTAAHQAGELAQMWERHSAERRAERAVSFPDFAAWRAEQGAAAPPTLTQWIPALGDSIDARPEDIRGYAGEADGAEVHYRRKDAGENTEVAFTDRGKTIEIHAEGEDREGAVLAALQLAQKKWGAVEVKSEDEGFRSLCVRLALDNGILLANEDLFARVSAGREARTATREAEWADQNASHAQDDETRENMERIARLARRRAEAWSGVFDPEAALEREKAEERVRAERLAAEEAERQRQREAQAALEREQAEERARAERLAEEAEEAARQREALRRGVLEEALIEAPFAEARRAQEAAEAQRKEALEKQAAYEAGEREKPGVIAAVLLPSRRRAHEARMEGLRAERDESAALAGTLEGRAEGLAQDAPGESVRRREVLEREGHAHRDGELRACVSEEALDALMAGRAPSGPVVDVERAEARLAVLEREAEEWDKAARRAEPERHGPEGLLEAHTPRTRAEEARWAEEEPPHGRYNALETARLIRRMEEACGRAKASFAGGWEKHMDPTDLKSLETERYRRYAEKLDAHIQEVHAAALYASREMEAAYVNSGMPGKTADLIEYIAGRKTGLLERIAEGGPEAEETFRRRIHDLEVSQRMVGGNLSLEEAAKDVEDIHKAAQERLRSAIRDINRLEEKGRDVDVMQGAPTRATDRGMER